VEFRHWTPRRPDLAWTAEGEIVDGQIVGQYRSAEGDDGAFMVTISPDHRFMYGFWMGASFDVARSLGKLAYGISDGDLDAAREKLKPAPKPQRSDR
jgi:hypothetical protein